MKVIFMGTPDFAASVLESLINSENEVLAVVTREDKPKNRGHEMQMPPVKELALKHNIDVLQPAKVKNNVELFDKLRAYNADAFVVAAYGKIIPKEILDMPKYGCINVHGSLLPKYRGAAPIQWAVIDGEEVTGITTMVMDEGIDTGDMLLKREIKITDEDTAETVFNKLSIIGGELLIETLKGIALGTVTKIKQDESKATYCKMLDKSDGEINWNTEAKKLFSFVRGMTPWPSAYTYLNGKMMKIIDLEKLDEEYADKKPGEIVDIVKNKGIVVKTADKSIIITRLQVEGKAAMNAADYLRGNKVEIGCLFGK